KSVDSWIVPGRMRPSRGALRLVRKPGRATGENPGPPAGFPGDGHPGFGHSRKAGPVSHGAKLCPDGPLRHRKQRKKHMAHMRAPLSAAAARVRVVDDQPATAVVTAITYLGAPVQDRPELERELSGASLRVVWADAGATIADLLRSGLPILIDFARGAAAL